MPDTVVPFPPRPGIRRTASPMPDPLGLVRLAAIQAEAAEHMRVSCIEHAADFADRMAIRIWAMPGDTLSKAQVIDLLQVLAQHIRAIKGLPGDEPTPGPPGAAA